MATKVDLELKHGPESACISSLHYACIGGKNILFVGAWDGAISGWDVDAPAAAAYKTKSSDKFDATISVNCMFYNSHDKLLYCGNDEGNIRSFKIVGKELAKEKNDFVGHTREVKDLTCHPVPSIRRLFSCGWDNHFKVWDLDSREVVMTYKEHRCAVGNLSVSADRIFTCSWDRCVKGYNLADIDTSRKSAWTNTAGSHTDACLSLCYANGKVYTGGRDMKIMEWDAKTGKKCGEDRDKHSGPVSCLYKNLDNDLFVSGSYDGTINIWDSKSSDNLPCKKALNVGAREIFSICAFGKWVFAGCNDGKARGFMLVLFIDDDF